MEKHIGRVIFFKKEWGFIGREGEKDIFVHWSDISSEGYKTLKKGQVVVFSIGTNKHGQPKAIEVCPIEKDNKA